MSVSSIGSSGGFNVAQMASQFFKKADVNGDGGIDKDELKTMLSNGPGGKNGSVDIDAIFSEVDTDGNGSISQTENESQMKKMGGQGGKPPAGGPPPGGGGAAKSGGAGSSSSSSGTYDVKDTNKDGTVSAQEEMAYSLKHAGEGSESKASKISKILEDAQKGQQYDWQGNASSSKQTQSSLSVYA